MKYISIKKEVVVLKNFKLFKMKEKMKTRPLMVATIIVSNDSKSPNLARNTKKFGGGGDDRFYEILPNYL